MGERRTIELVAVHALAPGEAEVVQFPEGRVPYRSILVLRVDDGFRAFWNVCRHLPVPLDGGLMIAPIEDGTLLCTTHGARYELDDGACTAGPCKGSPLEAIEIRVVDGKVVATVSTDGGAGWPP